MKRNLSLLLTRVHRASLDSFVKCQASNVKPQAESRAGAGMAWRARTNASCNPEGSLFMRRWERDIARAGPFIDVPRLLFCHSRNMVYQNQGAQIKACQRLCEFNLQLTLTGTEFGKGKVQVLLQYFQFCLIGVQLSRLPVECAFTMISHIAPLAKRSPAAAARPALSSPPCSGAWTRAGRAQGKKNDKWKSCILCCLLQSGFPFDIRSPP